MIRKQPEKLQGTIWGVTSYFNPNKYKNKLFNYKLFRKHNKRQRLKLLTIELVFGNNHFELTKNDADILIQLRTSFKNVLWQKERLLNIGIQKLPEDCDKVIWLDNDIIFRNNNWIQETSLLLEQYIVIQPFSHVINLPNKPMKLTDVPFGYCNGSRIHGLGYGAAHYGRDSLEDFFKHGVTGYAWAARRSLLKKHGLYDCMITGRADCFIGLAFYAKKTWATEIFPDSEDLKNWINKINDDVRASVYYTEGDILHIYHGELENRSYIKQTEMLRKCGFDPSKDIKLDKNGCWAWASDKPELHKWMRKFFAIREEEGKKLSGTLWGITTFFNPGQYSNKIENYRTFKESSKKQGLNLLCVELAYGDDKFELTENDADILIQLKASDVMWQRERLVNIGLTKLPSNCDKVVWLDNDIIFKNDNWVEQTSSLLEKFIVAQPFSHVVNLPKNPESLDMENLSSGYCIGGRIHSFGYGVPTYGIETLDNYHRHGVTGFAWATRRSFCEKHGFYDLLPLGSNDVIFSYALYNKNFLTDLPEILPESVEKYVKDVYEDVHGNISCVEGDIWHLWHGELGNRLYAERHDILEKYKFDPLTDLKTNKNGTLSWASDKPELHKWVKEYFFIRKEDRRKIELITVWYNESFLAPFFLKHYDFVDKIHLFYDEETTDNTMEFIKDNPKINIIPFKFPDKFDDAIKIKMINEKYKEIDADYVIVADADEFMFPENFGSLRNYIERYVTDVTFVKYYQVYKHPEETNMNINKPVWEQRKYGNVIFIKPAIVRCKLEGGFWAVGHHTFFYGPNLKYNFNGFKEIYNKSFKGLIGSHLNMIDLDFAINRIYHNRASRQSDFNRKNSLCIQYNNVTIEKLKKEYEEGQKAPKVF